MRNVLMTAVAVSALMTGAAFAADPYMPPPADVYLPEAGGVDWSGFYAGASVGYGWGEITDNDDPESVYIDDIDGFTVGVQAGYNVQFDNIVVGLEGDVSWADINVSEDDDEFDEDDGIEWVGTVRGRLGFAAESFLIYGTAGVAFAGLDVYDYDSETAVGWVAGVGAEFMVTDAVSLKAEYLYHDFGAVNFEDDDLDYTETLSTVKVGLNFHF